ncbi:hypothetical protein HA402_005695 [Bradysia odoriphaga]|nr:hypothetical protein HA402_005695 [Bradysia odoriphaga]
MFKLFRSRKRLLDIPSINYAEESPSQGDENASEPSKYKGGQVACEAFQEYCSYSTIHGTKYLGETQRHWLEKIWWIVAFACALLGCGTLIFKLYIKWEESPVIVSFSEKSTPIYEIPFPSVTICPETKAKKNMIDFTETYHKMLAGSRPSYGISDKELKYMEAVSHVCDSHLTDKFKIGGNVTDNSIIDLLKRMAPSFNDTMMLCKFRNKMEYCDDYFEEVLTDEGLCFTFNMINSKELYREGISSDFLQRNRNVASSWDLTSGYNQTVAHEPQMYPYRVLAAGSRGGLFVLLRLYEENLDYICKGPVQGFKILLHPPGESPQLSRQYFRVPLLQEVLVSVKPNMMETSDGLRRYNPNRRQCFFNSERYLRFFKVYTQHNCELECLANYTLKTCGCVRFSMPRDDDTPICGSSKIACYDAAEDDLLYEQYMLGIAVNRDSQHECNCLPSCTSIRYDAEISQATFDWERLKYAYKSTDEQHG